LDQGGGFGRSQGFTAFSPERGDGIFFQDVQEMKKLQKLEGTIIHKTKKGLG
jgi:hypothetical protein